jgi:hypothetical protein
MAAGGAGFSGKFSSSGPISIAGQRMTSYVREFARMQLPMTSEKWTENALCRHITN